MPEIPLQDALNKAYTKVPLERAEVGLFKKEFINLLDGVKDNPGEREEHFKNRIMAFLSKTWYDPDHYINTHNDFDMVIHNGEKSASPIGVIIEAKRPGKNSEMASRGNLNVKSMQQLLLYYLRSTIDDNNFHLKHLIITNTVEWFIFDAKEFYRHFSKDKNLIDLYMDFKKGGLYEKDSSYFYNAIASPRIEKKKNEISYVYINIEKFEESIRENDFARDNKLIDLYKIFSPQHLLKKSFPNDNNTLNSNFYFELLYILGLSEETVGGKKLIVRCPNDTRQNASLLESAMFHLSDDISHKDILFHVSFELVITWLNRILFLKLLEAQVLKYQGGNKSFAFLNAGVINSYSELNTLFFKVLAVKPSDRDGTIKKKYANVPYLNSSLFDKTDKEQRYPVSNLQNKEMALFPQTVLKDANGNRRKGKINSLEYMFSFLDAYDFSSGSSGTIKEKRKTLINASVLGLIFEKINGYKEGSYFTPGFITSFICSETIKQVIINKFNEAKNGGAKTFTDVYNKIDKISIEEANDIINSITVLDPAVGSGHFLVSALNEIIAIKSELGILADSKGKRIKDYKVSVFNDELDIYEADAKEYKSFEYNANNAEKQRLQETLFNEKRRIIENSLFGVDLNNNSVQICRLRLWIELLKSVYYTKMSKFKELETMPNLDLNIKCGNSLISRFETDTDISDTLQTLDFSVQDYKDAVVKYKGSTEKAARQNLIEKIEKIKANFRAKIKDYGRLFYRKISIEGELVSLKAQEEFFDDKNVKIKNEKRIAQLEKELSAVVTKMDEEERNKIYENAFEWRFEFPELLNNDGNFTGFDAVIGNPPYISASAMVESHLDVRQAMLNANRFTSLTQKWDIYIPFMELGLQLLSKNGLFAMIVPYPFTNQIYAKKLRELIISQYNIIEIVDLSGTKVFDRATVSNCIPIIAKTSSRKTCTISHINEEKQIAKSFKKKYSDLVQDEKNSVWNLTSENRKTGKHDEMNILGDFCYISKGMVLNADEKTAKREFAKDDLISETYDAVHCRKYIEAKDIERYRVKKIRYLEYNTKRCPGQLSRPTFKELYERPKLMFNRLGNLMVYFDKNTHFLHSDSMFSAVLWKNLKGIENKSISASVKRYSRYSRKEMEKHSANIDLRYLLGILNSKYASALLANIRGGDYHIYPEHLRNIPIPLLSKDCQLPLITLVDKIIKTKEKNPSAGTSSMENEIDKIVYSLYQLGQPETDVIEGRG